MLPGLASVPGPPAVALAVLSSGSNRPQLLDSVVQHALLQQMSTSMKGSPLQPLQQLCSSSCAAVAKNCAKT